MPERRYPKLGDALLLVIGLVSGFALSNAISIEKPSRHATGGLQAEANRVSPLLSIPPAGRCSAADPETRADDPNLVCEVDPVEVASSSLICGVDPGIPEADTCG